MVYSQDIRVKRIRSLDEDIKRHIKELTCWLNGLMQGKQGYAKVITRST